MRTSFQRWHDLQRTVLGLSVIAGIALSSLGCGQEEPLTPQPTPVPQSQKTAVRNDLNIILVTIDTLRSDRISCYGSDLVATPHIDSFAEEGVRFANAASTVPFTLPAHSSILTGLYPPGHGVRENVGYTLDKSIPTMAEVLAGNGYSTAAFVSAFVLDRRWGIGRGFEHYFDDFDLSGFESANLSSVQRSGDITIDEAVKWIDQRPLEKPFLLWLHLYDPHDPYEPLEPYKSMYKDRPYDGEVAYTDSLIGDFRQSLAERGLLENSLVILTADHGEGLGDHGEASHGFFVYDTTVHVALIMRLPDGTGAGQVVETAVSHVDLFPTVLDALKIDPPKTLHGRSLLPTVDDPGLRFERSVYSESLYPLLHYGWAPLRAIRMDNHKLIDAPRPEVYDLTADQYEQNDMSGAFPAMVEDLKQRLSTLRTQIESDTSEVETAADIDPHTLAQLEALGYAAGQGGVALDQEKDHPRADPKDKIVLHKRIMLAQSLVRNDPEKAKQVLFALLKEDSEILDVHQMLGQLADSQERFDDALRHFQRVLRLAPDHNNALLGVANSYYALGQLEEALVGFRRVLELSGNDTRATLAIADIEFERGEFEEAARALDASLKTTEAPALIHNKLGEIRVEQRRQDDAISLFKSAIAENDEFAVPHFNLAVLLEEQGRIQSAIDSYEKTIELAPNYYEALFNLGRLLGPQGHIDRQQTLWEEAIRCNPGFVQGHYHLAKLMMDRGQDLERAEELVRVGISKDPETNEGPLGYYLLADLLNRRGKHAEAKDALARGRQIQARMQ